MKRVVMSSIAVVAVLAVAATLLAPRSSLTRRPVAPTVIVSVHDLQADADGLPASQFGDQSMDVSAPR